MKAARRPLAALGLVALLASPAAHAGLFDDDEARRAILDLRQKLEQSNEQSRARLQEQMAQMADQLSQLKRSLLDLNTQIELLRADNARLRGQDEQLSRDVAELQRKQLDAQQAVDARVRKLEPIKVTVDDREFLVDPEEKRLYDEAMASLRRGEFDRAEPALVAFQRRYPSSGYRESVLFWLGNAQYARREYKDAITSFRTLVGAAPDNPKAPEALLAIANCQIELKDNKTARKTLDELLKAYPKAEAAQAAKERLATLK